MIKLLTVYLYLNMLCDIYEPDLKLNPPTPLLNQLISDMSFKAN